MPDARAGRITVDVSVVMATLGGPSVAATIERLRAGSLVPAEILICIPDSEAARVDVLASEDVRVIRTPSRGQVAQRAHGFRHARSSLVLQIDDDVLLEEACLERLVRFLETHPRTAVAPALLDRTTGRHTSFLVPDAQPSRWQQLLFWIINGRDGYQAGRIGRGGINMGVPESGDFVELDWLPGGCVLHRREDLELSMFYPFPGKAFAEDLFHSACLTSKGISLARCGAASCLVDFSSSSGPDLGHAAKDYLTYARRMADFVRRSGRSVAWLRVFLVANVFRLLARRFA